METNWHTVSVKLTDEELRIIEEYQNRHNVSRSKLIRIMMLGSLRALKMLDIIADPNSALAKTAMPIVKSIFNKKILKQIEKESKKKFDKIKPETKAQAIKDYNKVKDDISKFTKHNPVGAPSQKHRKRGRPKDVGI